MRASERVYRALRAEILDGTLAPGDVLAEVELSIRLGVSRTPVREAITRLVSDGLATGLSGRGTVVSEVSTGDITELYELRQALEAQAAALAAQRRTRPPFEALRERLLDAPTLLDGAEGGLRAYFELTRDFDQAIDDAVANNYLRTALRSVRLHSARIRRLSQHNPERLGAAAAEHLLIVDAILAGDASLAAHATHVHLHQSLSNAQAPAPTFTESPSSGRKSVADQGLSAAQGTFSDTDSTDTDTPSSSARDSKVA